MDVRAKKLQRRQSEPQPLAEPFRFPAPLRGWVLNEMLANPQPGGAKVLDNWIVGLNSIQPRKGVAKWATVGSKVHALFTYKVGATEHLFAATADSIYDITSPADPDVAPTADVGSLTGGDWQTVQFGTAGGDFLYAVNGADNARLYDGSAWTAITGVSTPAITGVDTADLSHVWSFANRLFFVEKGTMNAWYLPVDSIGGAANSFSLAGVFKRGGALLFGATWSTDSGDGPNDQCVFVSTEGEVAVYRGTNPGSAADWSRVGVYEITRPLGKRAIMRAGADLLIATATGLVPLSEAVRKDIAALSLGATSRAIEPYWQSRAAALTTEWQIAKWPSENLMVVSQPESTVTLGTCLVANLQTGAWSRFTGLDVQSVVYFAGGVYFGTSGGIVCQMQSGGSDNGASYTAVYLGLFEGLGLPGIGKTVLKARPIFTSNVPIRPQVRMLANFNETLSGAPNAASTSISEGWDFSTWDTSVWDAASGGGIGADDSQWIAIGVTGYAHAPEVQMTFGGGVAPTVEYIGADVVYRAGAMVA